MKDRRSKLDDATWVALLERYVRGESAQALATEHGVGLSSVQYQALRRGYRRKDRPDLVYVGERAPPVPGLSARAEELGFRFDPLDPGGSADGLLEKLERAAAEGRTGDFLKLDAIEQALRRRARRRDRPGGREDASDARSDDDEDGEEPEREPFAPHAGQRPPEGAWATWVFLGGRGAGKTRAGAEWAADRATAGAGRIALVGPTLHDVREVMCEGPSGLCALPRWGRGERPVYEAGRRRLAFSSGAYAYAFSSEDPESLRGPQFGAAWADELCAWRRPEETLALLRMGLRLGADPRLVVTTTPKPLGALRRLLAEPSAVVTRAATAANAGRLAPGFLEGLRLLYGGTRLEAQELEGRVLEAPEGALWRFQTLEACRVAAGPAGGYDKVVVAVDPPATAGGDACGIVAAGRAHGRAWVLADRTAGGLSPLGWAARTAETVRTFGAGAVVAEANQGGEMVRAVLATAGVDVPIRLVTAAVGKRARAEPVAALYEQGRVAHVGAFPALEEELCALGSEEGARGRSPDRADALVWAVTELLLAPRCDGPRIRLL